MGDTHMRPTGSVTRTNQWPPNQCNLLEEILDHFLDAVWVPCPPPPGIEGPGGQGGGRSVEFDIGCPTRSHPWAPHPLLSQIQS